eukprot:GSChrysophyteH1.ASY1.ANO1.2449.1 assembled CDS
MASITGAIIRYLAPMATTAIIRSDSFYHHRSGMSVYHHQSDSFCYLQNCQCSYENRSCVNHNFVNRYYENRSCVSHNYVNHHHYVR